MVLLVSTSQTRGQDIVLVRPGVIDSVLINPGIGFMTFQRFNGDRLNEGSRWTEGYPIAYQAFDRSLKNEGYPDTSLAYFRIYWKFIEPVQGQYRWDLIDKALETAGNRRQTLLLLQQVSRDLREDLRHKGHSVFGRSPVQSASPETSKYCHAQVKSK